jgi:uncharacterized Fe-S radical SAM superfamily protein PflX
VRRRVVIVHHDLGAARAVQDRDGDRVTILAAPRQRRRCDVKCRVERERLFGAQRIANRGARRNRQHCGEKQCIRVRHDVLPEVIDE